ncbi:MAG: hypothetical protein AB7D30_08800 [Lysobacteraceae bacterium]
MNQPLRGSSSAGEVMGLVSPLRISVGAGSSEAGLGAWLGARVAASGQSPSHWPKPGHDHDGRLPQAQAAQLFQESGHLGLLTPEIPPDA